MFLHSTDLTIDRGLCNLKLQLTLAIAAIVYIRRETARDRLKSKLNFHVKFYLKLLARYTHDGKISFYLSLAFAKLSLPEFVNFRRLWEKGWLHRRGEPYKAFCVTRLCEHFPASR